ncbi:MAG: YitT family protein, partial [Stomatobaculum sp.]|nr:YitT family protein [Stomatobaculum sp.]
MSQISEKDTTTGQEAAAEKTAAEKAVEKDYKTAAAEIVLKEERKAKDVRDAWLRSLHDSPVWRNVKTTVCVIVSAFIQAYVIQVFIRPAELLSSGFTGVALLIELLAKKFGFSFPAQIGMLCINIPVGLFCARGISKRFSIFSFLNVFLISFFLQICSFQPIFYDEPLLNVIFGGFLGGIGTVVALRGNASTGGTDFIAMYVSNKTGKSIWNHVFVGNCV